MNVTVTDQLTELTYQSGRLLIHEFIAELVRRFPGQVTFSTSFSFEDQVIAHEILKNELPVSIFTLDTGRLFPETYSVWTRTNEKYNTHINAFYPDYKSLETFISEKGPNAFYESVENRKACCFIRKVEPLKRALAGNKIWITGLRAEHSPDRNNLSVIEWDETNQVIKYNPLLHWIEASRQLGLAHYRPIDQLSYQMIFFSATIPLFFGLALYRLRRLSRVTT